MRRNRILLIAGACAILVAVALALMLVGLLAGDEDLIVVATGSGPPDLQRSGFGVGDVAYVTGELQVLSADEVTERLPRTSLLPSQFQGFDRQPVLLATEAIPAE